MASLDRHVEGPWVDGERWRGGRSDAEVVAGLAGGATVVAVTGGVAAGKSTFAAAVADRLGLTAVGADGFLLPNAVLSARGLDARKGYPETFDVEALAAFVAAVRAGEPARAPVYSHLHYDVTPEVRPVAGGVVLDGLHLAGVILRPGAADLVVHLDADDEVLESWYLDRFQALRRAAAQDPTAFLHPYRDLPGEVLDGMALDVWHAVNLPLLHDVVRPAAAAADVVLDLGPDHLARRACVR